MASEGSNDPIPVRGVRRRPGPVRGRLAEEPLLAEIRAFLDAVRSRTRPVVALEDGRRALALGLEILTEIGRHAGRVGVGVGPI